MKKLLLTIALVLFAGVAMAQKHYGVDNIKITSGELNSKTEPTYIAIRNLSRTNNYYYVGNTGKAPYSSATFTNEAVFIWEPVEEGVAGSYYLKKLNGDYMQTSSPKDFGDKSTAAKFTTTNPTSKGSGATLFNGDGDSQSFIDGNDDENLVRFVTDSKWINVQNGDTGTPTYNIGTGGWTIHHVYALKEAEAVEITYNFVYNNEVKYTENLEAVVGEPFPNYTLTFPFGVSAGATPEGTVTVKGSYDIELSVSLPFEYAKSYSQVKHWYYMNVRDDGPTYAYYDSSINYIKATETAVPADKKEVYCWAFIGDPFSGFEIVNYNAGSTMVLSSPEAPNANQNEKQLPRMVVKENATGNTKWMFVTPTHNAIAQNGFYVQHPTAKNYAINRQSYNGTATLCYWSGRDTGSVLQVVECDLTGFADLQALIAQVEAAIEVYGEGGTTVGYYTAESVAALAAALTAAKEAAEKNESAAANLAAQVALQKAVAALATIQPEVGKLYTIKNAYTGNYMNVSHESGATVYGSAALNEVFQFVPASEGKFYLYNVKRAKYLSTAKAHAYGQNLFAADDINNAKAVTIANLGLVNRVSIVPEGGAELHNDTNSGTVVGWNTGNADSKSAWLIEEVGNLDDFVHTLTVGEAGYATLCLGCNVAIPDGVKAYAVASTNSTHAVMEEITGAIPAKQAVIIVAEQGGYDFKYAKSAEAVEANLLKGTTVNANITEDAYALGKDENNVAYLGKVVYKVSTDTTNDDPEVTYEAWKNNAFKAYLPAVAGSANIASYSFRFPDTTGVDEVVVENEVKTIFDITGRKVEAITAPGIYIVGGKKVLVK